LSPVLYLGYAHTLWLSGVLFSFSPIRRVDF
jgi:hypothetical protein